MYIICFSFRSVASTIAELMENPPKLPDDVLQELLSQANVLKDDDGSLMSQRTTQGFLRKLKKSIL